MLTFAHDSDLHYGERGLEPREYKNLHPKSIIDSDAEFVIITGDLTDNGYDGSHLGCIQYGGDEDQVSPFIKHYVKPIKDAGKGVYMCAGNHDRGKKTWKISIYSPINNLIRKEYGGLNYTFEKQGLKFVCCDKYPKKLKWLKKQLVNPFQPTIIFFHYNLVGPFSNWWSEKSKDKFYNVVKDCNIIALLFGHHHISKIGTWKGITTISSANSFSLITYNPDTEKIVNIRFTN